MEIQPRFLSKHSQSNCHRRGHPRYLGIDPQEEQDADKEKETYNDMQVLKQRAQNARNLCSNRARFKRDPAGIGVDLGKQA